MRGTLKTLSVALACLFVIALAAPSLAQAPREPVGPQPQLLPIASGVYAPPQQPEWGTASPIAYVVPGWAFNNISSAQHAIYTDGYIYADTVGGEFNHAVNLPSGAQVLGVTLFSYDGNGVQNVQFVFNRWAGTVVGFTATELLSTATSEAPGYQRGYYTVVETIRNAAPGGEIRMYELRVSLPAADSALRFGGAVVWYQLQISPASLLPTFSDVPHGYWAYVQIEALAASGITAGCGGGNYCPESTVTRAEMAVFLAKALGLHWSDGSPL